MNWEKNKRLAKGSSARCWPTVSANLSQFYLRKRRFWIFRDTTTSNFFKKILKVRVQSWQSNKNKYYQLIYSNCQCWKHSLTQKIKLAFFISITDIFKSPWIKSRRLISASNSFKKMPIIELLYRIINFSQKNKIIYECNCSGNRANSELTEFIGEACNICCKEL